MTTKILTLALALPLIACGGSTTKGDGSIGTTHDLATSTTGDSAVTQDFTVTIGDMTTTVTVDMTGSKTDASSSSFITGVEDCAQADYVDGRTDSTKRTFAVWDTTFGKKCVHITKGQSMTWDGVPTASHPLAAHGTGTTPNPITNVSVNAFPNAGTYGFWCTIHMTLMHGAIWVE